MKTMFAATLLATFAVAAAGSVPAQEAPVTVTVTAAGNHVVTNLTPLELYAVTQDGTPICTRVSSTAGKISFPSTGPGTFVVTNCTLQPPTVTAYHKYVALHTPGAGETLVAPVGLRLMATAGDREGTTDRVEFYCDDTLIATVLTADGLFWTHKTRLSGLNLTAGTHKIWARSYGMHDLILDSVPRVIRVEAARTYGQTINLTSNLDLSGDYSLAGTSDSRIRVNGNGFGFTGAPNSLTLKYVDFVGMGHEGVFTLNVTTPGAVVLENCRFFECFTSQIATNGTGTVSCKGNLWASNSTFPVGQYPDGFVGGFAHRTDPAFIWAGTSSGAKAFETNNIAAGYINFSSPNWTIGGDEVAKSNISIGPRAGFNFSYPCTATVKKNYSHHDYPSTFSQGSCWEMGDVSAFLGEHNVIFGGSWPVRGCAGELRYNLIGGPGAEGWIWTFHGPANIHHNILAGPGSTRGAIFQIYGATGVRVQNNTINMMSPHTEGRLRFGDGGGDAIVDSNVILYGENPAVSISGGTLTTDYNCFFGGAGADYSDGRAPTHDVHGDPGFASPTTFPLSWNVQAVWERALTVETILSDYRKHYTPSAVVIDKGSTATYGAGNDIGAVGAGTENPADQFGRFGNVIDPNDTDGDGLPDSWEMAHFGNLSQIATGDPDGDGFNNLAEFNADTDPMDPLSPGSGAPPEPPESGGSCGFTGLDVVLLLGLLRLGWRVGLRCG